MEKNNVQRVRVVLAFVVFAAAAWLAGAAEKKGGEDADNQAITQKASELAVGKSSRFEKALAVQSFVKKEIVETPSQFG